MVDLIIVGSVALDSVKTPFGEVESTLGGAAVYSSFAASFFCQPGIVGVIGEDYPKEHLKLLAQHKIDTQGITQSGKSFRWTGYYQYDMNEAHTVSTDLGSFISFRPKLPESYKSAPYVFLANIDPELQLEVLEQVSSPRLVALDSMNYWIECKRETLLKVISHANVLLLNDSEARELFNTPNVVLAAKRAQEAGANTVIIKKGEHGALMFMDNKYFTATSYPMLEFKDPTGAGDSFAGGFMGYLARTQDLSEANMRKAVMYGSAMASFAVEDFSLERLKKLDEAQIERRFEELREIRAF